MEQSARGQFIFKRMLLYHWFRQGDNYQSASRKLCRDYGERFVSLKLARQTYECFRRPDFDFDKFSKGEPETERENDNGVSDLIDLDDEQTIAVDSILQESLPKQLKNEFVYPGQIENVAASSPISAATAEKIHHPSTSQTSTPHYSAISCVAPKEIEELRLYFLPPVEMAECNPNIIRRWRVRRCFESSYTIRETEAALNSLFGADYVNSNFIERWFKDFKNGYRAIKDRTQKSNKRIGRLPRYDPNSIVSFFTQNPNASLKDCQRHFPNYSTTNINNVLKRNGFERLFNSWKRRNPDEPEVSDEQLAEYKLRHPDAKAWEIGQHFGIFHIGIDARLRHLGFNVPEYPKKNKKKQSDDHNTTNEPSEPPENHDDSSNSSILDELSELMFELDGDGTSSNDVTQNSSLLNFNTSKYTPKRPANKGGRPRNSKNIAHKNRLIDPLTGQPITSIIDPAFIRLKNNLVAEKKPKNIKETKMSKELSAILNPAVGSPVLLPPIPKPEIVSNPKKSLVKKSKVLDEDEQPPSPIKAEDYILENPDIFSSTFISKGISLSEKRGKKRTFTDPNVLDLPEEFEKDASISLTFDPLSNLEEIDSVLHSKKKLLSTKAISNVVKVKISTLPIENIAKNEIG